jgi:hypothetical protein
MNVDRVLKSALADHHSSRHIVDIAGIKIAKYVGELWTSMQRQSSSLHEISYRACFKAQLPKFFIEFLSQPGEVVYDPFSGRGTTAIEAGLLGRRVIANDINPLSEILCRPRFSPPNISELKKRLEQIPLHSRMTPDIDLSMFYHRTTLTELISIKSYLTHKAELGSEDSLDRWIRMVATNRLTGHSKGFFSVYTLPPNQAVTQERQKLINLRLEQKPEYRDTRALILMKSISLLRHLDDVERSNLVKAGKTARFLSENAKRTPIRHNSVQLTVTSPPFLDIVHYTGDNWLRCWFNNVDIQKVQERIAVHSNVTEWSKTMSLVFGDLYRITKHGGWVAFEVGEVRRASIQLEEHVVPLGVRAGFAAEAIIINEQEFTKTSNIWGVKNNRRGTNSNRIVLFHKA